jgi:hypothetical protein
MGPSDYGLPIYLFVINGGKDSIRTFQKAQAGTSILINNAIHPGEPDGINACLIWLDQWMEQGKPLETKDGKKLPVIAFIPAYNVGGMMNRSSTSRANQNGPEEYGFRGNARNFDLNRDFIKSDTKNTHSFYKIFQEFNPDIFIDNHVSNGADYQSTEVLVVHDGNDATAVTYGTISTNGNLGVCAANIYLGNVKLNFIAALSNTIVRVKKDYLPI